MADKVNTEGIDKSQSNNLDHEFGGIIDIKFGLPKIS